MSQSQAVQPFMSFGNQRFFCKGAGATASFTDWAAMAN